MKLGKEEQGHKVPHMYIYSHPADCAASLLLIIYIESLSFVPFPKKIDLEFEASAYISYIYMSMYQYMRKALHQAKACLASHCSTHVVVCEKLTRTIVLDISE